MAAPLRLSLAQWSLHRAILSGALDPMSFPRAARRDYGIEAVELVSGLMGPPRRERLAALRRAADSEGVRVLLVMVDGEGDLSHPKERLRKKSVASHRRWVDAASSLGCPAVRVNAGGEGRLPGDAWRLDPAGPALRAAIERCAASVAALADHARPAGISVLLENHGGLSASPGAILKVLELAGRENTGSLPDFGNFPRGADPYEGVRLLMPRARAVSAKSFDFGEDGLETLIDYRRMLGLVREVGYEGWIGIEYEGDRLPEPEGIRKTKALLERIDG